MGGMEREQRLVGLVLAWYGREARDLPWRATRDPYAILVSEIMLQQTQVSRVEPSYRAFLARWPSVTSLAGAALGDVLIAWRGLGYNRRARNLHRAAVAIAREHGGVVPSDLAALRALPGIGDYTARAVLAFGFGRPEAPVDTNVGRVLARAVAGAPLGRAAGQRLADGLVPVEAPAAWSHALMDLGARVCLARRPRCGPCPIAGVCAWRMRGGPEAGADPATTSAIRSRPQRTFAGSDRYHRGRLVDALRGGPLGEAEVARAAELEDRERLRAIIDGLVAEGLAERAGGGLRLPGAPGPA